MGYFPSFSLLRLLILSIWLALMPGMAVAAPLNEILARGQVIVAVKDNLYPLGYRDAAGRLQGFEIELAQRIAQDLFGTEQALVLKPVTNAERLTVVESNQVDLAIAQISITENRMRVVSFSEPYYHSGTGILSKQAKWKTLQSLYRQAIAVLQPSVTLAYLPSTLPKARLVGVSSYESAKTLLDQGQVQAIVGDQVVLSGLAQRGSGYFFAPTSMTLQPLAVVMPKGLQYNPLLNRINSILRQQQFWLTQQRHRWRLP